MCQATNDHCLNPCCLGVKNADENELRSIATDPDDIHMYNVADFSFLLDIVDSLTNNLCNSVKGPGMCEFSSEYAWMILITTYRILSKPTAYSQTIDGQFKYRIEHTRPTDS